MSAKIDYAYIAGLLDGEGTVSITSQLDLRVCIRNTNRAVLDWIKSVIGEGNIYGDKRREKVCYSLELSSNKAAHFLKSVYPYLRIKKLQAKVALEFQEKANRVPSSTYYLIGSEKERRQIIYRQMKELNQ